MSEADRRMLRKLYPWNSKRPAEPHRYWRWMPHDELQKKYHAKFGKTAPPDVEEDEDD